MSKRKEVDDAMVERAWKIFQETAYGNSGMERMRLTLQAALNPPPEPVIPVSWDMITAGCAAFSDTAREKLYAGGILAHQVEAVYRAMESVRRKAEKPAATALPSCTHDWVYRSEWPVGAPTTKAPTIHCTKCPARGFKPSGTIAIKVAP